MQLLSGVKVLDISRLIPGPMTTMLLRDMGADVVKVEDRTNDDYLRVGRDPEKYSGQMPLFLWMNRGKRDVCIDMKSDEGKQILYELSKGFDVIVENARPGAAAKLGVGYEDFRKHNPKVIYASVTAFGQDGPYAHLGTHGGAYDATTGIAVPYQKKDGSYIQHRPYPHALTYGVWMAAMAICGALVQQKTRGVGAYLDIANTDATVNALGQELLGILNPEGGTRTGWPDPEEDQSVKYCYYQTKDGKFMLIQAIEQHFWVHFCEVVGRPDLATRGDWSRSKMDSGTGDMELREELIKIFATKTQDEWTKIFLENNIAGAPYHPVDELDETELFKARKMFVDQAVQGSKDTFRTAASGIKVAGDPWEPGVCPEKGEHTVQVLKEFGFPADKIEEWQKRGVVLQA